MREYASKTVYIGIDVHKNSYSVTAICDRQIVKKDRLTAEPLALAEYCQNKFKGAKIVTAYEAGFCGFSLHRALKCFGIENRIVHPAGIEVAVRERVKNDRRDSEKISSQLAEGRLRGIHVPTVEREGYREVSRLREELTRKRNRVSAQIKSFLHRQGLFAATDDGRLSKKKVAQLIEKQLSENLSYVLRKLCEEWLYLTEQLEEIKTKLEEQAEEDPLEKIYRSLPGIGPTVARVLANELGDMSQFSNEKQLFSYTGLTPREHSSGEHRWLGHISRQGKSIVRKMLVQAAWKAVSIDKGLGKKFENLSARVGSRRAIVAIARTMVGYARSCLRENRLYEERYQETVSTMA
jgi:transposase